MDVAGEVVSSVKAPVPKDFLLRYAMHFLLLTRFGVVNIESDVSLERK